MKELLDALRPLMAFVDSWDKDHKDNPDLDCTLYVLRNGSHEVLRISQLRAIREALQNTPTYEDFIRAEILQTERDEAMRHLESVLDGWMDYRTDYLSVEVQQARDFLQRSR